MRNLVQVNSPTLLQLEVGERNLVNRLMGLPKVESVHQIAQIQEPEQMANEFTMGATDETQVNETSKFRAEPAGILQKLVVSIDSDSLQPLKSSIQERMKKMLVKKI